MAKSKKTNGDRFLRASEIHEEIGMTRYFLDKYAAQGLIRRRKAGRESNCAVFFSVEDARRVWDTLTDGYDPAEMAD